MKIRKAQPKDLVKLVDIWLITSIQAHSFISKAYWERNKAEMQEKYLPNSDIYLVENKKSIYGFIALVKNKVAALFILLQHQGKGAGKLLIDYVKSIKTELELTVYQANENSILFYKRNNFQILKETIDNETKAKEFVMFWKK